MKPRLLHRAASGLGLGFVALVELAAWVLGPTRIGRLLQKVSLPKLRDNPLRTSVTALGVAIAVSAVVSVLLVNRSIVDSAQATVEDVAGKADLQITATAGGLDESNVERVRGVAGVYKATPVLEQTVLLREQAAPGERLLLLGLDLASSEDNYFRSHDGSEFEEINRDPLAFLDSSSNIVISRSLAERLGRKLHDTISIETPAGAKQFEIWGLLSDRELARAYGGQVAIMHHQSMQAAFARGTSIDRIDIAVRPNVSAANTAQRLRGIFGDKYRVEEPEEKNSRIAKMLVGLNTAMTAAGVVAVMIAMFLIYNTMLISVVQRKAEIGTLRALGAKADDTTRLLTLEGALIGGVASLLGVGLGIGLAQLMLGGMRDSVGQIYMTVGRGALRLDTTLLLECFALGCTATLFAAFIAARSAARVSPLDNLRLAIPAQRRVRGTPLSHSDVAGVLLILAVPLLTGVPRWTSLPLGEVASAPSLLLGTALLAPRALQSIHALLVVAGRRLGFSTMMANRNLTRDLTRAAVTTGALILGMGMATAFAVFISSFVKSADDWIAQATPADVFITSSAPGLVLHTPLPAQLGDTLAKLPRVDTLERVRIADLQYRNSTVKLFSTDAGPYSANSKMIMVEGDQASAMREVAAGTGTVVNESFSHHFGVHAGDHLVLPTKTGTIELHVAGVNVDYMSDQGVVMIDRSVYLEHWDDSTVDIFKLHARPGTNVESLRQAVSAKLGDQYDLLVLTGHEFAQRLTSQIDKVFSIMRALQAVALVIAIMGVVNAVSADVLDRTRELGILRAVGMQRAQLRSVVVVEALLLGTCGALVGCVVGIGAGRLILSSAAVAVVGWSIPLAPDWSTILGMAVTLILASAFAGWLPAHKAARLNIPEAVAYR